MINDYADVLSEETKVSLSSELEKYERETCHQIVVLIVKSLRGETIKELSARTASDWGIVNPILNNGILLSIAIDEGAARIETGTAFEAVIEQGAAEDILKKEMFPAFRSNDYAAGIDQGLKAIMKEAGTLKFPDELKPEICR